MKSLLSKLLLLAGFAAMIAACGPDPRTSQTSAANANPTEPAIVTVYNPQTGQYEQGQIVNCNGTPIGVLLKDVQTMETQCANGNAGGTLPPNSPVPTSDPTPIVDYGPTPATLPVTGTGEPDILGPFYLQGGKKIECPVTTCIGVKLQIWFPGSFDPYGIKEIHVIMPPGLSIDVSQAAGQAWRYPIGYDLQIALNEMETDRKNRAGRDNYYGVEDINTLIAKGAVTVIYDSRTSTPPTTPMPTRTTATLQPTNTPIAPATNTPAQPTATTLACNKIKEQRTPSIGNPWIFTLVGPGVLNFWTNETGKDQEEQTMTLRPGSYSILGGGTLTMYPQGCEAQAQQEMLSNGLPQTTYETWVSGRGLATR